MILAIVSLSFLITAVLFYLTLNMCYFAGSRLTDNEKMVLSANEISIKDDAKVNKKKSVPRRIVYFVLIEGSLV